MEERPRWWRTGTAGVVGIALATVVVHLSTGWRYGFDRDELMALEDARHLAWGYVQYPPMTAFFGWVALKLFGTSLGGFRLFAALVQAVALVLTGLMAKKMGGGKWAQMVAALAGVPFCLGAGALMQYISFDYVCWVLVAYGMVRLVSTEVVSGPSQEALRASEWRMGSQKVEEWKSERAQESNPQSRTRDSAWWWVVIGAGMGLGMMAKYTMGLLVAGVVVGVLATALRRYLRSGWLWLGVAVSWLVFLPNFLWQWKRDFISLEFLRFLHERDVQTGVTNGFFAGQLELTMLAFPLALAGLWFLFTRRKTSRGVEDDGRWNAEDRGGPASLRTSGQAEDGPYKSEAGRYRVLGWMYVVPLVLLVALRGRDYYLAPAYPMLYAAGAVWMERKSRRVEEWKSGRVGTLGWVTRAVVTALVVDIAVAGAVALPIAPVNSRWWKMAAKVDLVFPEEIGWEEFTESVAQVWRRIPEEERARSGILAGNYGEIGALNLYGEKWRLPRAISGVNSSWERGYGDPVPLTLVVVGYPPEFLQQHFLSCEVGGLVWNKYGVANEETIEDPEIFVCRDLQGSWREFWMAAKKYA